MKKSLIVFFVAGLVLVTTGIWYFSLDNGFRPMDLLHFGIILLIVGFALFVGYKRLKNVRRGEPAEDELSKKVLQKSAAISYFISLYIWVFLIYLKDRVSMDTEELLGTGVLAMAVTFGVVWVLLNFRGIRND
jgi:peptidoglycan/LPS O-acetylase OafA/YrhL